MRKLVVCALGALALSSPAIAQTDLDTDPAKDWRSPVSDFVAPPSIDGYSRTSVTRFDDEGFNISATYDDPLSESRITIYFYRAGVPDLPIWGDRAATAMLTGSSLAFDLERVVVRTFTPANRSGAQSGWLLTAPTGVPEYSASSLAIFGHDGWLVKLRITSATLDENELAEQIESVAKGLPLGLSDVAYPAYATVEDCEKPLAFKKSAKLVRLDMMSSILLGTILSAAQEKAAEESEGRAAPVWCRHPSTTAEYGIYQSAASDERYLVAFGDSGVSASVGAIRAADLLKPSKLYIVSVSDGVTLEVAQPFNRMPKPGQTIGAVQQSQRVFSADVRPDGSGERTIQVNTGD